MPTISEKLQERRLNRMRLGQAVADVKPLLSDPEIKVAMVPLTEAEYLQCLEKVNALEASESITGNFLRDRHNTNEILVRALREPDDLQKRLFRSIDDLTESLNVEDINYLIDAYFEMMAEVSPTAERLTDEDVEELKKVFEETDWKELTGKQCYVLKSFLSSLGYTLLPGNSLGSSLTNSLILTSENPESTQAVSPNSDR